VDLREAQDGAKRVEIVETMSSFLSSGPR